MPHSAFGIYSRTMITADPDPETMPPIIRHVVHPSDFSDASRAAFAHALKAALIAKGKLTLIHMTDDDKRDWSEFPGVRGNSGTLGHSASGKSARGSERTGNRRRESHRARLRSRWRC